MVPLMIWSFWAISSESFLRASTSSLARIYANNSSSLSAGSSTSSGAGLRLMEHLFTKQAGSDVQHLTISAAVHRVFPWSIVFSAAFCDRVNADYGTAQHSEEYSALPQRLRVLKLRWRRVQRFNSDPFRCVILFSDSIPPQVPSYHLKRSSFKLSCLSSCLRAPWLAS